MIFFVVVGGISNEDGVHEFEAVIASETSDARVVIDQASGMFPKLKQGNSLNIREIRLVGNDIESVITAVKDRFGEKNG